MLRWTDEQLKDYRESQGLDAKSKRLDKEPVRPKYRNKRTEIDGIKFDSLVEGARYVVLKRLQASGVISGLKCHEPYALPVNGVLVCKYIADFVYVDAEGCRVVEDVKGGAVTPVYALKKKLMKAIHGIEIKEVRKKRSPR